MPCVELVSRDDVCAVLACIREVVACMNRSKAVVSDRCGGKGMIGVRDASLCHAW